jgi:hypothetical protein
MNNYYILNREYILKKNLDYYYKHKEMIKQRNKQYFFNYYRQNKENIIKRVQNNYYSKVHAIPVYKTVMIHKQNNIIKNNIVISLMD